MNGRLRCQPARFCNIYSRAFPLARSDANKVLAHRPDEPKSHFAGPVGPYGHQSAPNGLEARLSAIESPLRRQLQLTIALRICTASAPALPRRRAFCMNHMNLLAPVLQPCVGACVPYDDFFGFPGSDRACRSSSVATIQDCRSRTAAWRSQASSGGKTGLACPGSRASEAARDKRAADPRKAARCAMNSSHRAACARRSSRIG